MREFVTLAHYPRDNVDIILESHISSYGLCIECSTFSKYVPYPCPVIKSIETELG